MIKRLSILASSLVGVVVTATPILAADPNPSFTLCAANATTTVAMEDCAKTGLADANQRLSLAYTKTMASLPGDQQAELRTAQDAWLAFREKDCRVFTGSDAGSIAAPNFGNCMVDRTETRIRDLAGFLAK